MSTTDNSGGDRYVAMQGLMQGLISLFFDSTMCIYGMTDPMHRTRQANLNSSMAYSSRTAHEVW